MSKDIERAKDLLKHTANFAYKEGLEYYGNMMLKAVDLIESGEVTSRFFYDFAEDIDGMRGPVESDKIQDVIDGDNDALIDAFTWSNSQQGHNYWSNIYHNRSKLTDYDIKYLEWLKGAG